MNTKLLVWTRRGDETSRDVAAGPIATFAVTSRRSAVSLARQLDAHGGVVANGLLLEGHLQLIGPPPTGRLATYHGVTIVYPSGRTRRVHA